MADRNSRLLSPSDRAWLVRLLAALESHVRDHLGPREHVRAVEHLPLCRLASAALDEARHRRCQLADAFEALGRVCAEVQLGSPMQVGEADDRRHGAPAIADLLEELQCLRQLGFGFSQQAVDGQLALEGLDGLAVGDPGQDRDVVAVPDALDEPGANPGRR